MQLPPDQEEEWRCSCFFISGSIFPFTSHVQRSFCLTSLDSHPCFVLFFHSCSPQCAVHMYLWVHTRKKGYFNFCKWKCVWLAACSHVEGMLLLFLGRFPEQLTPPLTYTHTHTSTFVRTSLGWLHSPALYPNHPSWPPDLNPTLTPTSNPCPWNP